MNSNPNLTFTPNITSGGMMKIGGSVATGNVGQTGTSSATGAGVKLNLNMTMPSMGSMGGSGGLSDMMKGSGGDSAALGDVAGLAEDGAMAAALMNLQNRPVYAVPVTILL
eukprot:CAMPEP_0170491470 /NCGR_PEP_ID=MMETSP0208-20121228/11055_1 /TAXON_ID=197538 /ORGANISM="Strombidium inclinatum, Strain S3" /LENGTH=110 /DNA_ID=CAMNT_0010767049 /DNA_START=48 /DNA_END=380 /DNA_ORIENTATION=+